MDDEMIISLFNKRDEQAIKETDEKYGRLCRLIANSILNNFELSEECVNSVFFKLWQAIPPLKPNSFRTLLITSVKNEAISVLRKEAPHRKNDVTAELAMFVSNEDVFTEIETKELNKIVNAFLGSLDEKSRRIFVLRYYYNCAFPLLADMFKMSENAVKKKLQYIKNKLKAFIAQNGFDV